MELNVYQIKEMLIQISDRIIEKQEYLCQLDSFVGDGDHGVTMSRGFGKVKEIVTAGSCSTASELFDAAGKALMSSMGGAIGPIYGSIFSGFTKAAKGCESIGLNIFCKMFEEALNKVKMVADVKEGQRTLVDSLSPATYALIDANTKNYSLPDAFAFAEEAAKKGMLSTIDMVATKGRAKFLGEKSRGYQDAGASGMYIFIDAIKDYVSALL